MTKNPRPKKSLGQHFLNDRAILRRIVDACDITSSDTVIEIGPGTGALTRLLAEKAKTLYALELDAGLIQRLREEFSSYANVRILHQDAVTVDPASFAGERIKVIGNIPYYISTPLLERLFAFRSKISIVGITVQKEFARRIVAPPGSKEYGCLSCFAQYHSDPEILFTIKRGSFFPVPKVDSSFLLLRMKQQVLFEADPAAETAFFRLVRAAFSQRRKMLKNTLKDIVPAGVLTDFFARKNIHPQSRAENVSLEDFAELAAAVHKL